MQKKVKETVYSVNAPAKINVGLRILSKRKDEYHNLETIFYPIKANDNIKLTIKSLPVPSKRNIIKVTMIPKGKISGSKNICYKAIEKFFEEFDIKEKYSVTVNIRKNIPMGAGLGGGSSDAAAVLKILFSHFHPVLISGTIRRMMILTDKPVMVQHDKLMSIALKLGSDVPFLLIGKAAYATGRGEKLVPLPEFKIKGKILLVNPWIHIATPWAFKSLGVKGTKKKIMNKVKNFTLDDERLMVNDFERVVFKKNPPIEKIKYDMYRHGADYSLMSGSGSTVYGIFTSGKIKDAVKYFKAKKYKVFVSCACYL